MSTLNQLFKQARIKKRKKIKTPALQQNPQKKGVCDKILIKTPKKPNSALRKVVKVTLSNDLKVEAYIPGAGHNLQKFSIILLRGGRTPDLPGLKYRLIRGKYDFQGLKSRITRRSVYACKKK